MDTSLIQTLKEIFKQFPQFWSGGNLQRSLVIDAIQKKDPQVIKALIANGKVKSIYGTEIDDVLIFDFDKLASLLKYKEYWANSFTKYRNKVGLTSEGKYLDYSSDVVLDFPFKDCVLEGGMTKEDQGKDEVYYNEVIARDEIDRLFSPKVFINSKRYTKEGIDENITEFQDDDNLIVKGNNLIALHSLKERYAGKVKLIYIDPPYNTEKDGFQYNDNFNQATWLIFIKNRAEISKKLLSDNGLFAIQITDKEQAYLKVLLDEVFGRENFLETIIWKKRSGAPNDKKIGAVHEYIILYAKKIELLELNLKPRTKEQLDRYKNPDNHPKGKWAPDNLMANVKGGRFVKSLYYPVINPNTNEEHYPSSNGNWRYNSTDMEKLLANREIYFGAEGLGRPQLKRFLVDLKHDGVPHDTLWTDVPLGRNGSQEILNLFGDINVFDTAKPEGFMQKIIQMGSKENDLVLDFHVGSGTTAAVAHKMGRRYIGIEQMDYINEITVPRLQKVIDGEQGGISKDVSWQGGGSFVYTDLMELNYVVIHQIEQAQNTKELLQLFDVMKAEAHLNYQIALDKVLGAEYEIDGVDHFVSFSDLELLEQKKLLIEVLDKNQLYVNASEMDDANLAISESDKAFTKSFYQKDC
jgi:adenine-specific DNA-methyltransferase